MYNIPAVGEEGLLAYCDLMSFELSLKLIFHFDTDVDFFLSLHHFEVKVTSLKF